MAKKYIFIYFVVIITPLRIKSQDIRLADSLRLVGEYNKSNEIYTELLSNGDSSSFLFFKRGLSFQGMMNDSLAINDFNIAEKLGYTQIDLFVSRAQSYQYRNNFSNCIADYSRAIIMDTTQIDLYTFRAYNYVLLKDFRLALDDFNLIIRRHQGKASSQLFYIRGYCYYETELYDLAISNFKESVGRDSTNSNLYFYYSMALMKTGQIKDAQQCLNRAIHLNPNNYTYYFEMGNLLSSLGKTQDACQYWQSARIMGHKEAQHYLSIHCK